MVDVTPTSTRKPKQGTASSSRKTVQIHTGRYSNLEKQVQSTILVSDYVFFRPNKIRLFFKVVSDFLSYPSQYHKNNMS